MKHPSKNKNQHSSYSIRIPLIVYTAFSQTASGGNFAGIVVQNQRLTNDQMQEIARKAGYSETVFILSSSGDLTFRYFTPEMEVPSCGHATLAAVKYLLDIQELKRSEGTVNTKGGDVYWKSDPVSGTVFIRQQEPQFGKIIKHEHLMPVLGLNPLSYMPEVPAQCVSTGLWDILVPVRSRKILNSIHPDMDKLRELSHQYRVTGMHIFAPGSGNVTAFCRNFAPAAGIPEEAATGTASGALAAYLYHHGILHEKNLHFRQGETLNRPSEIEVRFKHHHEAFPHIFVGGHTISIETRIISL